MSALRPAGNKSVRLFTSGAVTGNGADTTEDTLLTYVLPAGTLANVGDTLRLVAGGGFTGSTDSKTARVKVGTTNLQGASGSIASATNWLVEVIIVKTGANTQTLSSYSLVNNSAVTVGGSTQTLTDTSSLTFTVTGQNSTNSVASSVTVRTFTVDLIRA